MAKLKIELNENGVRELLRSNELKSICTQLATKTQSSLGEGYEVTSYTGKNRVNASIRATTRKTIKEAKENYSIMKALKG